MATTSAPGRTSSMPPIDNGGAASARRRPVAGRVGGPDSGSGDEGTGVIVTSVPQTRGKGTARLRRQGRKAVDFSEKAWTSGADGSAVTVVHLSGPVR